MNPLIEVCVYVPWGQEIMTRKCYNKEISTHWDNGTNGLLAPLTLVGRGVVPVNLPEGKCILKMSGTQNKGCPCIPNPFSEVQNRLLGETLF